MAELEDRVGALRKDTVVRALSAQSHGIVTKALLEHNRASRSDVRAVAPVQWRLNLRMLDRRYGHFSGPALFTSAIKASETVSATDSRVHKRRTGKSEAAASPDPPTVYI